MKILIMGLPGAGKTTLAKALTLALVARGHTFLWLNADEVRQHFDDWDFSHDGRIRQSIRMRDMATNSDDEFVIADFVAPLVEMRENYDADYTIWVDTLDESRFADTNKMFIPPEKYDVHVTNYDLEHWVDLILSEILQ